MADLDSLPLWLNVNSTYQPQDFRQLVDAVFGEGVLTGFTVSQRAAGANMSVDVAAGKAIVQGDSIALQGKYLAFEDSVKNEVVTAAPGANSRYDIVVLRIYDATATGSGSNKAALEVIAGTAAASPVVPATPASALLLASIGPITTSTTSITNGMISNVAATATLAFDVVDDVIATRLGVSTATASALMRRDASGRVAVASPSATGDAATKGYADALGTDFAAVNTIMRRSAANTAQIAAPVNPADIANKAYVDGKTWDTSAIADNAITTAKIADGAVTQPKVTTTWTQVSNGTSHAKWMKLGTTVFVFTFGTGNLTVNLPAGARPTTTLQVQTGVSVVQIETNGNITGIASTIGASFVYEAA